MYFLNGKYEYVLKYKVETNFMGTVTSVFYDTIYIQNILGLNDERLEKKYLFDEKNKEILEALEYSNLIYEDNVNLKSKTAKKIITRIDFYKSLLFDANIKYQEYRNNEVLRIKKQQDSIQLIKQNKDKMELLRIKQIEAHADSIRIVNNEITRKQFRNMEASGIGNNTFRLSPKMLTDLLLKNPTLRTLEKTFPQWSTNGSFNITTVHEGSYCSDRYYQLGLSYNLSVDYEQISQKVREIKFSDLTYNQVRAFEQSLIQNGFRLDAGSSDLANSISRRVSGHYDFYDYYEKPKCPIVFVLRSTEITVFKSKKK